MAPRRREKPQTIEVEQTRHSGVLYGPVRIVHPAIRKITHQWQYDHRRHAYLIPRRHIDAVCVEIERAGHRVQVDLPGWR